MGLAVAFLAPVLVEVVHDPALEPRAVEHRKVELLVGRGELDEQIEGLVEGARRVGVGPVRLVDDDDRPQPQTKRAHEHVAGLGHGAFVGVDQQEHRVDHAEHALDLAAEVGVARRVDDVDEVALPLDGAVLAADRDAAFALEVVAVHHALLDVGVVAEHARGAEDGVDQGRLAVIDVSDDGEVADVAGGMHGEGVRHLPLALRVDIGASRDAAAATPRLAPCSVHGPRRRRAGAAGTPARRPASSARPSGLTASRTSPNLAHASACAPGGRNRPASDTKEV